MSRVDQTKAYPEDYVPLWREQDPDAKEWNPDLKKCGQPTRQGNKWHPKGSPCQRPAGWGTEHKGYGWCKFHLGNSPAGISIAARELMMEELKTVMGPAMDIDPMEGLLWCVRIAAGEVAYATYQIEQLQEDDAIGSPEQSERKIGGGPTGDYEMTTKFPVELNVWIRVRQNSTDRLAKYCKMAADAGVEERKISLAETAGDDLALAFRELLDGLNLTAQQAAKAPELIRGVLVKLESTHTGSSNGSPRALIEG
jgi:hypothetical protein